MIRSERRDMVEVVYIDPLSGPLFAHGLRHRFGSLGSLAFFVTAQFCKHAEIFERRGVLNTLFARCDIP